MPGKYLENTRRANPVIYCITNFVTVNDCANILLACGASPVMSCAPEEAEDLASLCSGLLLNIGTADRQALSAMLRAGKTASALNKPVLFDPVGTGASAFRTMMSSSVIANIPVTAVKGNASEIRSLITGTSETRGVDASENDRYFSGSEEAMTEMMKRFSSETGAVIVMTGEKDYVCDKNRCAVISNGCAEMKKVTGTGCQLSALMTAFLSSGRGEPFEACLAAVCAMGLAGETALARMKQDEGSAAFRSRIIDAVSLMDGSTLDRGAKYEYR